MKKISNKTIFYLVYSPPEQCAHNELESTLDVSGFEPAASKLTFRPEHLSPSFTTMNKFILVICEYSSYLISSLHVLLYPNIFNLYRSCTSQFCSQSRTLFIHD